MGKNILQNRVNLIFICLFISLLTIGSASALTGKVGNGKFVISNATVGDVIEREIKIINDNDFEVNVELFPTGNLSDYIKILDNNITMSPNSERYFRFNVKVPQEGQNDGGIVVKFIPVDMVTYGKNGIAIPTTMIIFAKKGTGTIDWTSWLGGDNTDKNNTNSNNDSDSPSSFGIIGILLMLTAIVFVILLIILFLYSKRKNTRQISGVKEEKLNTKKRKN